MSPRTRRQSYRAVAALTCKPRDSWWTVLLVDPLAVAIVWLVQPYRRLTPNVFTALAFVFGVASAGTFVRGGALELVVGAALFYVSFLFDCVDGKVARLRGGGAFTGIWLDFLVDRVRFLIAVAGLFAGQFWRTGNAVFVAAGVGVVVLDLLYYVNGAEVKKISLAMQDRLAQALAGARPAARSPLTALAPQSPFVSRFRTASDWLLRHRIRPRLVSGVEYEQVVCVVAPLTGSVLAVSGLAMVMDVVFEIAVIVLLFRSAREVTRVLSGASAGSEATVVLPRIVDASPLDVKPSPA